MDLSGSSPNAESSLNLETTEESVFDPDYRSLADPNDYMDGGKYRAIVKLQMRYEKQSADDHAYAMGTGWLISPNMLVTAGHNVYSWAGIEGGLGRAVHINCYIGYHGRDSIDSPTVQHRFAKTIVTTAEWLTSKDNRHRDVAFIQLDRPFTGNLRVFSYKPTPKAGDEMLGVVGYPADKSLADKDGREEKGALMYEMFNDVQYNLEDKKNNTLQMLKYRISTFGGQSGAPVIRKNGSQIAIATHVYGSGDKNQASAIGKYGNDYDSLIGVFSNNYPVVGSHEGISLVKPTSATSNGIVPLTPSFSKAPVINPTGSVRVEKSINGAEKLLSSKEKQSNGVESSSSSAEKSIDGDQAEGFIDALKSVGNVVAPVGKRMVQFVSPLFGPAGGVVSAVAGAALGAVANACAESAMEGMDTEKLIQGTAERAILAEASLQAVLKMARSPVTDKILSHMEIIYTKQAPNVKYIAPKLAPGLLSSAYKITVDKDFIQKEHATRRLLPARPLKGNWAESSLNSNDFVECMMQPTRPLEGEEAFFDQYSNDLVVALQTKDILLREAAKAGLLRLNKALAESSFDAESSLDSQDTQAAELVAKRAIMAEAALQAVMKLNKSEISEVQLVNDQNGVHEEGFIDFVKAAGQKIGSYVKANAIPLAKRIIPLVRDALAPKPDPTSASTSSSAAATKTARGKLAPAAPVQTLRKHRSVLSLVNDGTLKVSPRPQDTSLLRRVDSNEDLPVFQEL
ncbi:trypsin-like cysteine/serine peptidase domain-containing protein [Xylaria sp. FL0064]|nr:trypsin-like cysteine/serine peptidase domain-containing protein [Xylaria sp. FL0064]